jgi:hypothetical protein
MMVNGGGREVARRECTADAVPSLREKRHHNSAGPEAESSAVNGRAKNKKKGGTTMKTRIVYTVDVGDLALAAALLVHTIMK